MSFQAYLDNAEAKTGLTPRQLVELAQAQGFGPDSKATPVVAWLKETYGLGHGHATAVAHVVTKGDRISGRSEERRVGKECRSRWSPYH